MSEPRNYRVISYPEYTCELTEYNVRGLGVIFAHLDVRDNTPKTLKRLKREWKLLRSCVSYPIFAYRGTEDGDDRAYGHFMRFLGFESTGLDITCHNGETRPLYLSVRNG